MVSFRDYTGAVFSVDANRSKNSNEFSLNAHPRFALCISLYAPLRNSNIVSDSEVYLSVRGSQMKIIVIFVSNSERKRF